MQDEQKVFVYKKYICKECRVTVDSASKQVNKRELCQYGHKLVRTPTATAYFVSFAFGLILFPLGAWGWGGLARQTGIPGLGFLLVILYFGCGVWTIVLGLKLFRQGPPLKKLGTYNLLAGAGIMIGLGLTFLAAAYYHPV